MKTLSYQRGMSIPGMMLIAAMVGFFVMCSILMFPRYMEYLSIRNIVETVAREYNPDEEDLADIRRRLDTMFNTNQINDLQPKDVEVFHKEGRTYIDANYEVRVPIMGIVDAVMTFDDLKIETRATQR
ncbi:MAG: DUF4845 domain-containing protein [Halioglobus sp.]|nr:DUF4845 domain-containing protein [Halioglobus sp.]MBP6724960.1 DUF4845 domain-containing protein [Halioglobus sp.]